MATPQKKTSPPIFRESNGANGSNPSPQYSDRVFWPSYIPYPTRVVLVARGKKETVRMPRRSKRVVEVTTHTEHHLAGVGRGWVGWGGRVGVGWCGRVGEGGMW